MENSVLKVPQVPMAPVRSSNIDSIGYDRILTTLYIKFRGGTVVYRYKGIPPALHSEMIASESIGGFFAKHVKQNFVAEKVVFESLEPEKVVEEVSEPEKVVEIEGPEEKRVKQVCLYVTGKCNLRCKYCRVPESLRSVTDMDTSQMLDAMSIIAKAINPDFLVLFGGEPMLRPDIGLIIDKANELELQYTLITNGTIDNEPLFRKCRGLTLSIDLPKGMAPKSGANETQKSNWDMLLKYKDIVPDLVANVTVTSANIEYLSNIAKELDDLGIWVIYGLVHSTRSRSEKGCGFRSYCKDLLLNQDQLAIFNNVLQSTQKRHNVSEYGKLAPWFGQNLLWHCQLNPRNSEYMTILPDGSFIACNDFWGGSELRKHTIFDLTKGFTVLDWQELCTKERSKCPFGCFYNHEIQLAYEGRLKHLED